MLLNMLMASSVVLVVFAVIFITSYTRVQSENEARLAFGVSNIFMVRGSSGAFYSDENMLSEARFDWFEERFEGSRTFDSMTQIQGESRFETINLPPREGYYETRRLLPGAGVSFSVLIDPDNNIMEIDSWVDLSPEAIEHVTILASGVINLNRNTVIMDGRTWRAATSPVALIHNVNLGTLGGLSVIAEAPETGYNQIRFIDVTESYEMLRSLALTLTAASLVVLTVFFFISRFFAKQAVKPMEEAWEKQRQFITDASHELKTPLSVINANCGVLYSNQDEPLNEQIRWVDSISRATDRMTGLVGSLLSLASMDDVQFEMQSTSFDLGEEVTAAVNEMEAVAAEKGITVTKVIEPDINIESDKEQIRKILSTLMENAVKYTPYNGEITTTLIKEKRYIIYTIRNNGEGIPEDELPNVFDRFYRGDPARSSDNSGYGLGLAIAKTIADKLSIKISANSIAGEYTEFKLIFE